MTAYRYSIDTAKSEPITEIADRFGGHRLTRRSGGKCPICGHSDCFSWSPKDDTDIFQCFSCGRSGNSVQFLSFLMTGKQTKSDLTSDDIMDATKEIYKLFNLTETETGTPDRQVRQRTSQSSSDDRKKFKTGFSEIYAAYISYLEEFHDDSLLAYLDGRRIDDRLRKQYNIRTFSESDVFRIENHLKKSFSVESLQECGLFNAAGHCVFNCHRIVFPSYSRQDVIHITGRITDDDKFRQVRRLEPDAKVPKYLAVSNVPKMPYNVNVLDKAVSDVYVVEGQLDAISATELDRPAVALGSWNISPNVYAGLLQRIKDKDLTVCFVFDNDDAGMQATKTRIFDVPLLQYCEEIGLRYKELRLSDSAEKVDYNDVLKTELSFLINDDNIGDFLWIDSYFNDEETEFQLSDIARREGMTTAKVREIFRQLSEIDYFRPKFGLYDDKIVINKESITF